MLKTLVNNLKSLLGGGNTLKNIKSLVVGMTLGVSTGLMIPQKYYKMVPIKWIKIFKSWLLSQPK